MTFFSERARLTSLRFGPGWTTVYCKMPDARSSHALAAKANKCSDLILSEAAVRHLTAQSDTVSVFSPVLYFASIIYPAVWSVSGTIFYKIACIRKLRYTTHAFTNRYHMRNRTRNHMLFFMIYIADTTPKEIFFFLLFVSFVVQN